MGDYLDSDYMLTQLKGKKYSATGLPESTVNGWIEEEEAYVNSRVGNRYKVPVIEGTSPIAHKLLRGIVKAFVKDLMLQFDEVKNAETRAEQGTEFSRNKTAEGRLKLIESGGMNLSDAEALDEGENKSASGFASENNIKHTFEKTDPRIDAGSQW